MTRKILGVVIMVYWNGLTIVLCRRCDDKGVRKLGVQEQKEAMPDEDAEYKEDLPPAGWTSMHRC